MSFAPIDVHHDMVVRTAAIKAREEAAECPHCFMPVHPSNHERHMQMYHPDVDYLNASEVVMFHDREKRIGAGLKIYYDVGNALLDIRDHRLYREHYASFEEYCQQRWQMSKTHANRLISASVVVENLTPIGVIPANEAQARELAKHEPDDQKIIALTVKAIAKELDVPVSAPLIKATAKTYATAMATGTFENGNGEQVKVPDAVVSQVATEVTENIKRQKTYIHSEIERKKERKAAQLATPETTTPTYLFETERTANGLFYVTVRYGMFANAADANAALIQLQKRIEKDCTK